MGRLADLSVVITGASSGIGESIAQRFWEEGARLTLGSRSEPPSVGAGVRWHQTDVADPDAADALIAQAVANWGKLDVLVNNAGVQVEKPITDTSDVEYDSVMDVNVRGVFNCSRAAVRQMQAQSGGGSIINIASVHGFVGSAPNTQAGYVASKAGLVNLTRELALQWATRGIRVF